MNNIDIARCIHGTFQDAATFTPEQLALAKALIVDGPPNNRSVVLKKDAACVWDPETRTLTHHGVSVTMKLPEPAMAWTQSPATGQDGEVILERV